MPVLNDADKLYVGDQEVSAVYVGETKVWPLPEGEEDHE